MLNISSDIALPPLPSVLLGRLYADGLPVTAPDAVVRGTLALRGWAPTTMYSESVVVRHGYNRYEALTGHPF
jgi:hypothetical protein